MEEARTYQFKDSYLTLMFGDITTSKAEVLVSSDDYKLTMSGGVSRAIRQAGGNQIPLDAAKMTPATVGDVVVTTAGMLPARYIFHAVTIGSSTTPALASEVLSKSTRRCMQLLEAFKLGSIAFPAIGAGTANFPYEEVAAQMSEVIAEDLQKRDRPVKVALYLYDPLGRKQPIDYIEFFEEFAARRPRIAEHQTSGPMAEQMEPPSKQVFVSYSHKDNSWLERFQKMLQPMLRNGTMSLWSDNAIKPGSTWKGEIDRALASAKVALLLVSPNFLSSDFIDKHELPTLLDKAKSQGTRIFPIYISSCLYNESKLAPYQAVNDVGKPLDKLNVARRNEVMVEICQRIKEGMN